jgi:subtilisin family serine protease
MEADRFLIANGNSPYCNTTNIGGEKVSPGKGTSYAAPRVAGYVAILRQKFPNLNAEKSASVLLYTARYDTLICYPNCSPSIYGKGEESVSRALAPVGNLR